MKTVMIGLALLTGIFACQAPVEETLPTDISGIRTLLQEKKSQMRHLQTEIDQLQSELNKLDTTLRVSKSLVTVAPVMRKDFEHFVTIQGSIEADDIVNASSEVGGRIMALKVDEGDYVRKGQLIASIDLEALDKQMAEIETSLELAKEVFERQSRLWSQKIGSEIQYLQAKNNKERLEKSLETLQYQRTKSEVHAPIAGAVDRVFVKDGEMASPGAPIVQILNTARLKVVADAPENLLGSIQRGDRVEVYFPAIDQTQHSTVTLLGRSIDPANRTFEIEATVRNTSGLIKPNLLAEIRVSDYKEEDVMVIPLELVQQEVNGRDYVLVKGGDPGNWKAQKVYVQTGNSYKSDIVITEGLKEGDELIIAGARGISDQELIEISETEIAEK